MYTSIKKHHVTYNLHIAYNQLCFNKAGKFLKKVKKFIRERRLPTVCVGGLKGADESIYYVRTYLFCNTRKQ